MRFFFDNTTSSRFVAALRQLERDHETRHLSELFRVDTPDEEWISKLAEQGDWIVISGDLRITRNPGQRKAWLESGLVAFFLAPGWANLQLWDHSWRLLKWWPAIVLQASRIRAPAGFIVPVSASKLEQLRI